MEEKKLKNVLGFYLLASKLKYKIRSGWDLNHWNINSDRLESIAEHVYGTCILAISIDSEFESDIDLNKVLKMLVLHEIGEVLIGDITPFDKILPSEKKKREHDAIKNIVGDLVKKDEIIDLLLEFDEHKSKESIFAYYCDKLEADIQAKVYQDMGYQNPLSMQKNNVVVNSDKIKMIIDNGALTAFDVWYEYDKNIYKDDLVFVEILDYIKNIDTEKLVDLTIFDISC